MRELTLKDLHRKLISLDFVAQTSWANSLTELYNWLIAEFPALAATPQSSVPTGRHDGSGDPDTSNAKLWVPAAPQSSVPTAISELWDAYVKLECSCDGPEYICYFHQNIEEEIAKVGKCGYSGWVANLVAASKLAYNQGTIDEFQRKQMATAPQSTPAPAESLCQCKASDAWKCAWNRSLTGQIACTCACHKPSTPAVADAPDYLQLVRKVLSWHQTAYARFHCAEGYKVVEADGMAIGYAAVELEKLLAASSTPAQGKK